MARRNTTKGKKSLLIEESMHTELKKYSDIFNIPMKLIVEDLLRDYFHNNPIPDREHARLISRLRKK